MSWNYVILDVVQDDVLRQHVEDEEEKESLLVCLTGAKE